MDKSKEYDSEIEIMDENTSWTELFKISGV
jgi:hypothetical protein